jgi:hypothetical protein
MGLAATGRILLSVPACRNPYFDLGPNTEFWNRSICSNNRDTLQNLNIPETFPVAPVGIPHISTDEMREVDCVMIKDGHLPISYPGDATLIRSNRLRGENLAADSDNS